MRLQRFAFCDGGSGGVGVSGGSSDGDSGGGHDSGIPSQDDSQLLNSSISVENEKAFRTNGRTYGQTHS